MSTFDIVKATGERETYSRKKLCSSLADAGAPDQMVDRVCSAVEHALVPGMSTTDIFRSALRILALENVGVAGKYSLKRGIAMLGPAGFYFERFVEVLLRALEYETERNQMMQGACVEHEVDIVAKKGGERILIEAKYHNSPNIKTHVDVVMYAGARLEDVARRQEALGEDTRYRMWLFTNTKFTATAIQYGMCRNIALTGWKYPKGNSLEDLVSRFALYPVTVLPSMNRDTLEGLSTHNMMLAQDLVPYSPKELVRHTGIELHRAERLVAEAHDLVYGN